MKQFILRFCQFVFSFLGNDFKRKTIVHLATAFKVNLLGLAYNNVGILNYKNLQVSGEQHVIKKVLPKYMGASPVLFDVGANIGNYSKVLHNTFPSADIFSFEPNTVTYEALEKNLGEFHNIRRCNLGLSRETKEASIYFEQQNHISPFTTLYKELVPEQDVLEMSIHLTTLDNFCYEHGIEEIDFLKIDTEGHEYDVLMGAKEMIRNQKVKIIQFEFNEMHVISRVFLRDLYLLLKGYDFYRLLPNGLLPLNPYHSRFEIFQFQNILCVREGLV